MNKTLSTLYIYNGIFILASGLFGPLYAVYLQGLGASVQTISISWSLFLISTTICTVFVARFGDRMRHKKYLLLGGFLIRALVWILYIFVDSIAMLLLLQIMLGIGEALGSPVYSSLVAEHLDRGMHIREYSQMSIIFTFASAMGALLGGFIVVLFGFTTLFICMAILASVSFFGILVQPKRLL